MHAIARFIAILLLTGSAYAQNVVQVNPPPPQAQSLGGYGTSGNVLIDSGSAWTSQAFSGALTLTAGGVASLAGGDTTRHEISLGTADSPTWSGVTSTGNVSATGATSFFSVGSATATGPKFNINRAAGNQGGMLWQTASVNRWFWYATQGAESGSNVGSDLELDGYADSGGYLVTPLVISRATGNVTTYYNLIIDNAGKGLQVKTGSNACMGTGTLSSGTVTVATTAVLTASEVFVTDTSSSGTNVGSLYVSAISNATSFTVKSTNASDGSTFNWFIVNPAP